MSDTGRLVYLYGPPAVGKLTVARRLQERTEFRLFHNHLTVDALVSVFDFGSPPFTEVLHRVRLDVFSTAARTGVDVLFTNNSAWAVDDGRAKFAAFAETVRRTVEDGGGVVHYVRLVAPPNVLLQRVANESRRQHGKLLDAARLEQILDTHDERSLHDDDLVIDTATLEPDAAAAEIAETLAL